MRLVGCMETREVWLNGNSLPLHKSLRACNHSPDGFNWGYGGSGPAQLALAVLLEFTNDDVQTALECHQEFKWRFIACLPQSDFDLEVPDEEIRDFIKTILGDRV